MIEFLINGIEKLYKDKIEDMIIKGVKEAISKIYKDAEKFVDRRIIKHNLIISLEDKIQIEEEKNKKLENELEIIRQKLAKEMWYNSENKEKLDGKIKKLENELEIITKILAERKCSGRRGRQYFK